MWKHFCSQQTSFRKSTGVTNNISNGCTQSKCPNKPVVQHEQYQQPEAKWNPAIVNWYIYMCFSNWDMPNIFYKRGSIGQKHNFLKNAKKLQMRWKQSYPADFLQLHSKENKQLYFYEVRVGIHSISIMVWRVSGVPSCGRWWGGNTSWWSRRSACSHTLLVIHPAHENMLYSLGSTLKNPSHTLWLTPFLLCFLSSSTITHTARLKNIPIAVEERHNTVLFSPAAHVIKGWKSTDTCSDISVPKTVDVTCLCKLLLSGKRCEGGKGP